MWEKKQKQISWFCCPWQSCVWSNFLYNWIWKSTMMMSPVNSPHKGQWRGALMLSLICAWINDWVNNREAGDLRCHRAHYDVTVMQKMIQWNLIITWYIIMWYLITWQNSGKWTRIRLWTLKEHFYTLRPRQNGCHFAEDTFKSIFFNENIRISIKIPL